MHYNTRSSIVYRYRRIIEIYNVSLRFYYYFDSIRIDFIIDLNFNEFSPFIRLFYNDPNLINNILDFIDDSEKYVMKNNVSTEIIC